MLKSLKNSKFLFITFENDKFLQINIFFYLTMKMPMGRRYASSNRAHYLSSQQETRQEEPNLFTDIVNFVFGSSKKQAIVITNKDKNLEYASGEYYVVFVLFDNGRDKADAVVESVHKDVNDAIKAFDRVLKEKGSSVDSSKIKRNLLTSIGGDKIGVSLVAYERKKVSNPRSELKKQKF